MKSDGQTLELSKKISKELPYLRRYARALTGSQDSGDRYAVATLESILKDRSIFKVGVAVRVGLFKTFHRIWLQSDGVIDEETSSMHSRAQVHMSGLTPNSREALLLRTIEEFTVEEISYITDLTESKIENLIETAHTEMQASARGQIMIIEDEAVIAADLKAIVEHLGHTVTGIARTRSQAVELGKSVKPALILADIQLADNSSGIDAVNDLLSDIGDIPVIFITAFPERLLTGDRPEPAFLISKPYKEAQVSSAISQAMFFSSTENLTI
jgi:CheY-like chemotaxis protein